jgi:transglutaminase-like putative cysteine protease
MTTRTDYFGNQVSSFSVLEPHETLTITATSIVDVQPAQGELGSALSWEEARRMMAAPPDEECLAACEYAYDSPFVRASKELSEYAEADFKAGRPLFEAARELSSRIHREFKYKPKSTSIDTPVEEVLKTKQGVCQDFAHLMIGALRSMGLAARYISGYLKSGAELQGADASHAWVAVFIPGTGWVSFDPTNDVTPSEGHLTLAWGRDYGDVTPLKGISLGGGGDETIEVEVRVHPLAKA